VQIFDRRLVRLHRERAAAGFASHDFLFREAAARLADRLDDVTRRFPLALDLGCHGGELAAAVAGRGGIETLVQSDLAPAMARRAAGTGWPTLAADEELLPFGPECFDLVLSNLSLHWVNDLPGCLAQVRECLRPDGLFLAALLAGDTLQELRQVLVEAELATSGGAGPRVSPLADPGDLGGLLQRAGFALPVVDGDRLTATYTDLAALLGDIRRMGEASALDLGPGRPLRRDILARADELYRRRFADRDGRLTATFHVVYLTGWAPAATQQRPLRPGSANLRLAEALDAVEHSAGERAPAGKA